MKPVAVKVIQFKDNTGKSFSVIECAAMLVNLPIITLTASETYLTSQKKKKKKSKGHKTLTYNISLATDSSKLSTAD